MKSTKRVRWARHLVVKMTSTPHPEFGSQLSLREILTDAKGLLESGRTLQRKAPAMAKHHVRVVDIEMRESHAVILFRFIDKDAPDSVYEDFDSGALEPHKKSPSQGNRLTAHLAIALDGKAVGDVQTFNAALEVVSGISRGLIEQRLTSIGRRCGRYEGSIDGGKTSVIVSATFTIVQFVERTIRQELSDGVLNTFTLEHKEPRDAGFDSDRLVKKDKRKIELRVVANDWRSKLDDIIRSVQATAQSEGYELIKAHYETPENRPASADLNAHRQDALEDMVAKVSRLTLDKDVHPDQTKVEPCLCERLIALVS